MRRFESCRPSQTAGTLEIRNGKKCVKLEQTQRQDENPRFDLIRRERIGTAAKPLARRAKGRKPTVSPAIRRVPGAVFDSCCHTGSHRQQYGVAQ